jgi:uncharacterized protein
VICPACQQEMIVVELKKIELDICAFCRGVWFDADELRLLLESLRLKVDEMGRDPAKPTQEKGRKCPYCRKDMLKALIGPGEGVMVDRCKNGHGLWFDGGELDAVILNLEAAEHIAPDSAKARKVGAFLKDVLHSGKDKGK